MKRLNISQLLWDDFNKEHIKKHNVTLFEIEQALQDFQAKSKCAHSGRVFVFGRCEARLLAIVLARETDDKYYVVTARDMSKKEREFYRNS